MAGSCSALDRVGESHRSGPATWVTMTHLQVVCQARVEIVASIASFADVLASECLGRALSRGLASRQLGLRAMVAWGAAKLPDDALQVANGACKAVHAGDDEDVALAQEVQQRRHLHPALPAGAAALLRADDITAGGAQGSLLTAEILVRGADPVHSLRSSVPLFRWGLDSP